ncbi:Hypothetical protein GbCGDNIH9_7134b [Granulibacter bethesdensis]|uniref:Uncharacterized protein n=1 Tax=Granulibacter bethesdensis TaxID=364410 RepID=A0AAC9P8T5_9PROT|nr:hypothetical protein [Granulibacter bethesdensis]APH54858.1 Hypothetical protein GbCGDNIH9_7134b [Granulibacter bethesdensis]APH62444.1 Hypothetical protein GbCGDNIH8_7134a [Granulibacter bethesdensis]
MVHFAPWVMTPTDMLQLAALNEPTTVQSSDQEGAAHGQKD